MSRHFFTSESVTEGHPDKICDQISDAVLDEILSKDPDARVACETTCATGMVMIMGEITTHCYADIQSIARRVINEIGYNRPGLNFDGDSCAVLTHLHEQSGDIAMGVDRAMEAKNGSDCGEDETGAGDQGMMFGYACSETKELMPMPIQLAHALAKKLTALRKDGVLPYLRPDGKTQVTVEYDENNRPVRVDTVVVSTQHDPDTPLKQIREDLTEKLIRATVPSGLLDEHTKIYVNPTGRFVLGGPAADTGLTGRKIIVDTYGGYGKHGGGCFSGKDPTKVDRSASYYARYIAKNIVAAGLADRCEVQLAYAIGVAKPVSVMVDSFGTGKYSDDRLADAVCSVFDMRPASIIRQLDLRRPIYRQLAAYGHMGREDLGVAWEKTDRTADLLRCFN